MTNNLQTVQGRGALARYLLDVRAWTVAPPAAELTIAELQTFYPDWQDD